LKTIILFFFRLGLPESVRSFVRRYLLKTDQILIGDLKNFIFKDVESSKSKSYFKRKLQKSHSTTLVNLLHYGDAISMAFAIESRLPFMDYRLVDFVMTLPSEYLIANGKGKFLQRESLKDILPEFINNDIKKLGFNTPIESFFQQNKSKIKEILLSQRCIDRGIFDYQKLEKLINSDVTLSVNKSYFLFRLLCVELWFQTFIDIELKD
jgi:asparagine synthase (glutamine-hydrolysing)